MSQMALHDWLAAERTALCVIDAQVDFISPQGCLGVLGVDVVPLEQPLTQVQALLAKARSTGVPVYFVGLRQPVEGCPASWQLWMERTNRALEISNGLCREGSPGAEFYGVQPLTGETVIWKQRYSAFYGTDLAAQLRNAGIDTLVVCGFTTECCVDSTVRDAFHQDFSVFIASDACGAYDLEQHRHSLDVLAESFAIRLDTGAIINAWSTPHE